MARLSWLYHSLVRAVVPEISALIRAHGRDGQTIDFLLTAKRDAVAAKRFFRKTLLDPANLQPRVINVDKNRAYPVAWRHSRSRAHSGPAAGFASANT